MTENEARIQSPSLVVDHLGTEYYATTMGRYRKKALVHIPDIQLTFDASWRAVAKAITNKKPLKY